MVVIGGDFGGIQGDAEVRFKVVFVKYEKLAKGVVRNIF